MKSIICTVLAIIFYHSSEASAFDLKVPTLGINLNTDKVTEVTTEIGADEYKKYSASVMKTLFVPGPRVVILNSPGGRIDIGNQIIALMELEKSLGTQQICIVNQYAHSMAFNILSHCDVRIAQPKAKMIFHKARIFAFGMATAKDLRRVAKILDAADKPIAEFNRKVLGMSSKQYDKFSDAEFVWSSEDFLARGYIHAIVNIWPKS